MAKEDNGPGRDYFNVNRISKQTNGGLKIDYSATYPAGNDEFDEESDNKKSSRPPVDSFLKELNSLKTYVAKVVNYTNILNISSDPKLKITKEQSKVITNLYNDFVRKITINGVKLFMTGSMVTACEIHYSLEGYNSQSMDHSTYKIDIAEGGDYKHAFEDELRNTLQNIVSYSYEYIFNRAGAQLQIID